MLWSCCTNGHTSADILEAVSSGARHIHGFDFNIEKSGSLFHTAHLRLQFGNISSNQ